MVKTRTILWSVPRSVSTAFERALVELSYILEKDNLENIEVFHEPFSKPFYYSKEKRSNRFNIINDELNYTDTLNLILDSKKDHIFSKDMGYYVSHDLKNLISDKINHTFIIRHPLKTINSLYKATYNANNYKQEIGFDKNEIGFSDLLDIFNYVKNELGQNPIIIDSDDLLLNPELYLKAYCNKVGLPWKPEILKWEKGIIPKGWEDWQGWHDDAINSNGLKKRTKIDKHIDSINNELKQYIDDNMQAYNELCKYKLIIE